MTIGTSTGDATAAKIERYFDGAERERAVASLREYLRTFSGRAFERLADRDPDRITANDIVAVSTLGVTVPPETAIWLLSPEGQHQTSTLLRGIPLVPIWDAAADLSRSSDAWRLWHLLHDRPDMGNTKTSKLMAAKRPALVPVYDKFIATALGFSNGVYWAAMQEALNGESIRTAATDVASQLGLTHLSVLRVVDIVVWMRTHGFEFVTKPLERLGYDQPLDASG